MDKSIACWLSITPATVHSSQNHHLRNLRIFCHCIGSSWTWIEFEIGLIGSLNHCCKLLDYSFCIVTDKLKCVRSCWTYWAWAKHVNPSQLWIEQWALSSSKFHFYLFHVFISSSWVSALMILDRRSIRHQLGINQASWYKLSTWIWPCDSTECHRPRRARHLQIQSTVYSYVLKQNMSRSRNSSAILSGARLKQWHVQAKSLPSCTAPDNRYRKLPRFTGKLPSVQLCFRTWNPRFWGLVPTF
jgi:hypothetical protein